MKNWFLLRERKGSVLSPELVGKWDWEVEAVQNVSSEVLPSAVGFRSLWVRFELVSGLLTFARMGQVPPSPPFTPGTRSTSVFSVCRLI